MYRIILLLMLVSFHFTFSKTSKVLKKYVLINYCMSSIFFTYIKKSILRNGQNLLFQILLLLLRFLKYLSRFMKLIKGRLEAVALKPPLIDLQTFIVCAPVCARVCVCSYILSA